MCGIVGFLGDNPEKILIDRLKKLEYRGYDSAGVAVKSQNKVNIFKSKGEIKNLENIIKTTENACLGIGHTRWATHGKPDEINAHPHLSSDGKWIVVHNGIIENYLTLKDKLVNDGYNFYSETDTEIIAKLLEYYSKSGSTLDAIKNTVNKLNGSFALCILHKDDNHLFFVKNRSPLYVAKNADSVMVASDVVCFKGFSEEYYNIPDGYYGFADSNNVKFFDKLGEVRLSTSELDLCEFESETTFKHFMLKEIYETAPSIKNILEHYSLKNNRKQFDKIDFSKIKKFKFVGCGTAYHACLVGSDMLEEKTNVECNAYVASEFRYSNPKIGEDTLVVLVSQSGETADTLAALELARQKGAYTVAIVNVEYSTLAKCADCYLPIKAGVEVGVASTKAYCAQLAVLYIFSQIIYEKMGLGSFNLDDLENLSKNFEYGNVTEFKLLADALKYNDRIFMIGRGVDYYSALEASLKIKETSYINSDTYYAGELKHGFLALIENDTYVIVFATDKKVLSKTISNAEEARARGAKLILLTCFDFKPHELDNFHYVIKVKNANGPLQSILNIVPWQIIAYYTSIFKGINPDKPRNLAKSVTVE